MSDLKIDDYDKDFFDSLQILAGSYYAIISTQGSCVRQNATKLFVNSKFANKAISLFCKTCPVRQECLEYALIAEELSCVWGGFSENYRDSIQINLRKKLKNDYPNSQMAVPFTFNKFLWDTLISEFNRLAILPELIYINEGKIPKGKNKQKNLLVD